MTGRRSLPSQPIRVTGAHRAGAPAAASKSVAAGHTFLDLIQQVVHVAGDAGEALGIVAPNGAGKTTLLRILARITNPTEGIARTRGTVGALLHVGTGFRYELTGVRTSSSTLPSDATRTACDCVWHSRWRPICSHRSS
jgi:hypothetical protein